MVDSKPQTIIELNLKVNDEVYKEDKERDKDR